MSWRLITDDWRLKLLALGLAILMLGAVAFAQNPPTQKVLKNVTIDYTVKEDLIVINPPLTTSVTVSGLGDTLQTVTSSNIAASFDLTRVSAGSSVHVNLAVRSLITGVTVQDPIVPYVLNIDQKLSVTLPVTVRTQTVTAGWQATKKEARCPSAPCSVIFTGPASWKDGIKAFADFTDPVQQNSIDALGQPVVLELNGQPFNINTTRTAPPLSLDQLTVNIHIEAITGTTSRQVVLIDAPPSHGPPPGYRVTNVAVDPITVVISGAPAVLNKITTITLPPVDLSRSASDASFPVAIPYPDGVTGGVANAKVTYSISPNPNG